MASTSTVNPPASDGAAQELLRSCLAGERWSPALLQQALAEDNGRAFFSVVVERLADLFEPRLCAVYADLVSPLVSLVQPSWTATALRQRYDRVRMPRPCTQEPEIILVLSRVTLGADVAITSVVLNGLKERFPKARIFLVGARKNWELFAADSRIEHFPLDYPRSGTLLDRLQAAPHFQTNSSIVVDPDSRITQLGLLPVCEEKQYYFFESRGYGGEGSEALSVLADRWMTETFSTSSQAPYVAPNKVPMMADVAVSFGVGENPEKRIEGSFERDLLLALTQRGLSSIVDCGAEASESARVLAATHNVAGVRTWNGSYASFASMISQAKVYVGYDSAGQHVAAAAGVPLVSIFAGHVSKRMLARWYPTGPGPKQVLDVSDRRPARILPHVSDALDKLLAR